MKRFMQMWAAVIVPVVLAFLGYQWWVTKTAIHNENRVTIVEKRIDTLMEYCCGEIQKDFFETVQKDAKK
jgi:hypothetical protein